MATSGCTVEVAADIDALMLDKTSTITIGNRTPSDFAPAPGVTKQELAAAAHLTSLANEPPEGRGVRKGSANSAQKSVDSQGGLHQT